MNNSRVINGPQLFHTGCDWLLLERQVRLEIWKSPGTWTLAGSADEQRRFPDIVLLPVLRGFWMALMMGNLVLTGIYMESCFLEQAENPHPPNYANSVQGLLSFLHKIITICK